MTHWLGFLSVARKLGLLGLLALLMVALPLGLLLQRIGDGIDSAGDQQAAAAPLLQLQRSTQWLQQHRGLGAQWLAGADEARGKLDELRPRLQAQLQSAAAALAQIDEAAAGRCRALGERLATLGIALDQQRLSGPQSFAEHTALVRESMQLGQEIADRQGLSMSPQPAIHHLVLASVFTQPQLGEALAQARGLGSQILARGALQPAERARIAGLVARLDDSTEVFASFTRSFTASPMLDQRLGAQAEATAAKLERARTMIQSELLDAEQPTLATATYWAELSAALDAQVALSAAAMEALRELLDNQVDALAAERNRTVAGLLALALLAALLAALISRSISRPLARAVQFAEAIGAGQLDTRIELDSSRDETGRLLQRLAAMRDNLRERIEAERAAAQQNLRLGKALDAAQSGVMVADNDNLIVYMNKRVRDILRRSEADLRREYPQFSVDALIGSPFDIFHRSPERSRKVVERLADGKTHRMDITVAGHHFRQHLCLLHDDSGARMGSMVDWTDRTTEVVIEEEVGRIVQAAAQGQLDGRIGIEDKEGFIRRLGGNINALLDSTLHGIQEVHGILEALSAGDLSRRSNADLHGVFLSMRDDANHAADRLEAVIGTIQQAAGAIHTAASEIASGNADLSERTEQQAANLEETASSMEELTSTVRQNADASRQARALALSAADVASRGGGEVGQVVATMQAISASSRRIEDIIGVIDGIAFQTNILALNAAVEAARAGDQGRGFAVVASEVRTLAQRSAEAAKEIKTLIAQSTATVADGARLVEHAGATMGDIVGSVARVNELIGDITAATEEQSAGIDTVNTTVIQLDQMTQQNAALVEQASAAARAMEDQAAQLADAVSVFRLRRR